MIRVEDRGCRCISVIPPALDQVREHPEVVSDEVPRLLEELAEVPNARDPRGARHALVAVLTLTACAILAGTNSLLAGHADLTWGRTPPARSSTSLAVPVRRTVCGASDGRTWRAGLAG